MSKEQLERIIDDIMYQELSDLSGGVRYKTVKLKKQDYDYLIDQAEQRVEQSEKVYDLQSFLQDNAADLANEKLGHHVIDAAIHVMKKQAERVQKLEDNKNEFRKWWQDEARYNNKLIEQNKRYRKVINTALDMLQGTGRDNIKVGNVSYLLTELLKEDEE